MDNQNTQSSITAPLTPTPITTPPVSVDPSMPVAPAPVVDPINTTVVTSPTPDTIDAAQQDLNQALNGLNVAPPSPATPIVSVTPPQTPAPIAIPAEPVITAAPIAAVAPTLPPVPQENPDLTQAQ